MRYTNLHRLSPSEFKRLVGLPRACFDELLNVLEQAERHKLKAGRPSPLSLADQLLLTLNYWREYRTLFHLGHDYGVHESTAQRTVVRVENRLTAAGQGSLVQSVKCPAPEVVIVDASESPIERPKKNRAITIAVRNTLTPRSSRS